MVPTIEPTLILPLERSPGGGAGMPLFRFAGDPPYLFVCEGIWGYPWYRFLQWHAPTIAAVVLLLTLGAMSVRALRRWRWPRSVGLIYCRHCNHQLSPPNAAVDEAGRAKWLTEAALCPECGTRTGNVPAVGLSCGKRTGLEWLIGLPLAVGCAVVLALTLSPYPGNQRFVTEPTWPVAGLEKHAGIFALTRRMDSIDQHGMRITRVDPRSGETKVLLRLWKPGWSDPFVSPDGRWVVQSDGRQRSVLLLVNCESGRVREVPIPVPFDRYVRVSAFSTDSKRMYVDSHDSRRDRETCTLWCIELETGAIKEIKKLEIEHPAEWRDRTSSGSCFAVRDDGGDVRWVHQQMYGQARTGKGLYVFRRPSGDGVEAIEFPDSHLGITSWPILLEDGSISFADFYDDPHAIVDLKARKIVPPRGGSDALWRNGYFNWSGDGYRVMEWRKDEPVAILSIPLGSNPSTKLQVSADARWAVAFVNRMPPGTAPGVRPAIQDRIYEIRLWDLSRLPQVPVKSESKQSPANGN